MDRGPRSSVGFHAHPASRSTKELTRRPKRHGGSFRERAKFGSALVRGPSRQMSGYGADSSRFENRDECSRIFLDQGSTAFIA